MATTANDIVTAALAGVAAAQQAYDDSIATLHAAQDFAAVPQTGSTFADLSAAAAQVQTLTDANAALTKDNAALTSHVQLLGGDIDAILAAAQKAKADE